MMKKTLGALTVVASLTAGVAVADITQPPTQHINFTVSAQIPNKQSQVVVALDTTRADNSSDIVLPTDAKWDVPGTFQEAKRYIKISIPAGLNGGSIAFHVTSPQVKTNGPVGPLAPAFNVPFKGIKKTENLQVSIYPLSMRTDQPMMNIPIASTDQGHALFCINKENFGKTFPDIGFDFFPQAMAASDVKDIAPGTTGTASISLDVQPVISDQPCKSS